MRERTLEAVFDNDGNARAAPLVLGGQPIRDLAAGARARAASDGGRCAAASDGSRKPPTWLGRIGNWGGERPARPRRLAALVQGDVGLALPAGLASTEDSVSYGARGIIGGNDNE